MSCVSDPVSAPQEASETQLRLRDFLAPSLSRVTQEHAPLGLGLADRAHGVSAFPNVPGDSSAIWGGKGSRSGGCGGCS